MKRVILDTSVYGKIVEEPEIAALIFQKLSKDLVIYGTDVIKDELRDTPKSSLHQGKNLRGKLLSFYRGFVKKSHHDLQHNKLIATLAKDYFLEYRRQGGNISDKKLRNDLTIIAVATIYKLDIVVSDDEKSMFSGAAIAAYRIANKLYGMPDPIFKPYRIFRQELLKSKNQEERPL